MNDLNKQYFSTDPADEDEILYGFWSNGTISLRTRYRNNKTHGLVETFNIMGQQTSFMLVLKEITEGEKIKIIYEQH